MLKFLRKVKNKTVSALMSFDGWVCDRLRINKPPDSEIIKQIQHLDFTGIDPTAKEDKELLFIQTRFPDILQESVALSKINQLLAQLLHAAPAAQRASTKTLSDLWPAEPMFISCNEYYSAAGRYIDTNLLMQAYITEAREFLRLTHFDPAALSVTQSNVLARTAHVREDTLRHMARYLDLIL